MRRVLVNGIEGAGLPGDDPGFTRGLNAFETMRTYNGRLFRLEQHLDRLFGSCSALDIPLPDRDELRSEALSVAAIAANVVVRIALTAGGNRVTTVEPADLDRVGRPLHVATVELQPLEFLPGTVKHGSRAAWVIAARRLDVDEVMLVDRSGLILECNRSNVVAVVDGAVCTPPLDGGLLAGVTRSAVLEAAREAGLMVRVAPLRRSAPFSALYATSTLKEIAPIVTLDGQKLASWDPVGRALQASLAIVFARECGP